MNQPWVRSRRLKMGLSRTELAAAAGAFQQVQKYERGTNRISASPMIQFAAKLAVAPAYFVEGFGSGSEADGDTTKSAAPSRRSPPAMRMWRCWRRWRIAIVDFRTSTGTTP